MVGKMLDQHGMVILQQSSCCTHTTLHLYWEWVNIIRTALYALTVHMHACMQWEQHMLHTWSMYYQHSWACIKHWYNSCAHMCLLMHVLLVHTCMYSCTVVKSTTLASVHWGHSLICDVILCTILMYLYATIHCPYRALLLLQVQRIISKNYFYSIVKPLSDYQSIRT